MSPQINFDIKPNGAISISFLEKGMTSFHEASQFVKNLPYGRNKNKTDLTTLFLDGCGTCSTKHALLKQLAVENNRDDIQLIMAIFLMNAENTPKIAATLKRHNLEYIPEAHNYLKWRNEILDFTSKGSKPSDFENELVEEIEIRPSQITWFKTAYHKQYLKNWLEKHPSISLTPDELWDIREQCIADLSAG